MACLKFEGKLFQVVYKKAKSGKTYEELCENNVSQFMFCYSGLCEYILSYNWHSLVTVTIHQVPETDVQKILINYYKKIVLDNRFQILNIYLLHHGSLLCHFKLGQKNFFYICDVTQ